MKKTLKSIIGLVMMSMIVSISLTACGSDEPQGNHDKRLIGTWICEEPAYGGILITEEITFKSNGDYEWLSSIKQETTQVQSDWMKGTWESDGKQVTFTQTSSSDNDNDGQIKSLQYSVGSNYLNLGGMNFKRNK